MNAIRHTYVIQIGAGVVCGCAFSVAVIGALRHDWLIAVTNVITALTNLLMIDGQRKYRQFLRELLREKPR